MYMYIYIYIYMYIYIYIYTHTDICTYIICSLRRGGPRGGAGAPPVLPRRHGADRHVARLDPLLL